LLTIEIPDDALGGAHGGDMAGAVSGAQLDRGRGSTMARLVIFLSLVLCVGMAGSAFAQSASTPASTEFKAEAAAKSHCPGETVVWATLSRAKAYHLSGDRYYGKTRHGAYMCRNDAIKAGMHQAGHRSTTSTQSSSTGGTAGTGSTTH
jgi:hypothetical protein